MERPRESYYAFRDDKGSVARMAVVRGRRAVRDEAPTLLDTREISERMPVSQTRPKKVSSWPPPPPLVPITEGTMVMGFDPRFLEQSSRSKTTVVPTRAKSSAFVKAMVLVVLPPIVAAICVLAFSGGSEHKTQTAPVVRPTP